jgi:hypothetical protein
VTLANANSSSFVNAGTQVVAGTLNREEDDDVEDYTAGGYSLRCWPWDSTSTYPSWSIIPPAVIGMSVPMSVSAPMMMAKIASNDEQMGLEEVIVTAQKVSEEQLGDLKLYRVPFATTVAANAQKQVLLLDQKSVPFERIYRGKIGIDEEQDPEPMTAILRTRNEVKNDLGMALPSGAVAVFETVSARPMMAGEDNMRDAAVHEEVEIKVGDAPGVRIETMEDADKVGHFIIKVSNDHPYAIKAEVEMSVDDDISIASAQPRHGQKNGRPIWRVSVPANGTSIIRYAVRRKG